MGICQSWRGVTKFQRGFVVQAEGFVISPASWNIQLTMLASIRHCDSQAGCLSEPLAGMEMRSDKAGLKKRWGREKKAQFEPPEWLDSIGCEFNSSGSQLSSRPRASRKMIKDAIRSVFKDESEGLPFLLWRSLCLSILLLFSRPALKTSDLLLQMMACQADRGQSLATCGICPSFPVATAALSQTCVVCACTSTCHAVGWEVVVCQIRLPWQCGNNMHFCT